MSKDLSAELTRPLFEDAIAQLLERIQASVNQLLASAGVAHEQINTVFYTGGSSGIPALRQSIDHLLPQARKAEGDQFGSIGSGLAIEAFKRYG
ncbi:Hsp70 family protein [Pseudomonas asuensis]